MTVLGAMVVIAITGVFFSAAVLIIKGGQADSPGGFQPSLGMPGHKQVNRTR